MTRGEAEVCVLPDAVAVARHAAAWLAQRLDSGGERTYAVCLAGGSTPRILYDTLAQAPYRETMPWQRIEWFFGDERFVPAADARSNYGMVRERLFRRVPVPRERIHPIAFGDDLACEAVAAAYEEELKRFHGGGRLGPGRPLFDVTLLGIGEDGHTASLFPGSPALHERTRWTACVPGDVPRITLTFPVLESSREVAFLVTGEAKREILRRILAGEAGLPAAMLRPAGGVRWLVDRGAAPAGSA